LVPVLAARFLVRRRLPAAGPLYNHLADGYEGLLRRGLKIPRIMVLLAILTVIPGWWLFSHVKTGFMPEMDEGAFAVDYELPVGSSLQRTDKALRRMDAVLDHTEGVSGYIRRTGAELGFFATESYTGDTLVSLKPSGQRQGQEEIADALAERLKEEIPELKTLETVPLIRDQINDMSGVDKPIEVKVFGPDVAQLRKLSAEVGKIVETAGAGEVNPHVQLENPD
jgi:Cu/Ag efflux pump CusA